MVAVSAIAGGSTLVCTQCRSTLLPDTLRRLLAGANAVTATPAFSSMTPAPPPKAARHDEVHSSALSEVIESVKIIEQEDPKFFSLLQAFLAGLTNGFPRRPPI